MTQREWNGMDGIRWVAVLLLGAPFTRRARLDVRFCAVGAITGVAGFALVAVTLALALAFSASVAGAVVGLSLAVAATSIARLLGAVHRRALWRAIGERIGSPAPLQAGPGGPGRLVRRQVWQLRDLDGWRPVAYAGLKLPVAVAEGYAVVATVIGLVDCAYPLVWVAFGNRPVGNRLKPLKELFPVYHGQHWVVKTWSGTLTTALLGVVCVLVGVWLARAMVLVDAWLMRSLLGPSRVSELERTRAIAVEDAASALRRVERDLHDGAQVRLAAVTLNLGMALEKTDNDALRELLSAAQGEVSGALADLRRIVRGIHPPVLDSGLADALASLAASCPIPVRIRAELPERPSPAIETMAYFCTAELLANAIKHSSANLIEIMIDSERVHVLRIRVADDGIGGAASHRGSGLEGLAQRASTVDGTMRVVSPPGGPTLVTIELPMRVHGGGGT
jgi:signal transduction histidine kinase